jgi:porin
MKKIALKLLTTLVVGIASERASADSLPATLPAVLSGRGLSTVVQPIPPPTVELSKDPPTQPMTPPMTPAMPPPMGPPAGAYDALQNITGCPSAEQPPTPPPLPPYGGPLHERANLLGDWGGLRGKLRDHGFTFDIYSTNFFADVANGGLQETLKYRGRMDYLMHLDGEKAGLWKGFFVDLHAETIYGDSINSATGTISPPSFAQLVPVPNGSTTALTGVKFTQALSERLLVFAGKINLGDSFNQPFTGGARGVDGFWNAGMLFPLTFARTIPYSSLGAGFAVLKGAEPLLSFMVLDTNDSTRRSGFDTFFQNGVVMLASLNVPTNFFGLPGHQGISGSYSNREYKIVDREALVTSILGLNSPTKIGSWSLAYSFDQALYVAPDNPKRSWGTFGNLGLADTNPSPFRWFGNIGFGGSSLITGRKLDTWGLGFYYLGLNDKFKNIAPNRLPLGDEQAVELFYNYAVTPWFRVTPDMQVLFPAQRRADTTLLLGLRAKIDF